MRTPPLLMAAALLFWGWQADFLPVAVAMALILEGPRLFKARWDMSDADIIRIWNFCTLLGLAAAVFAFTSNEGPANFGKLFEKPDLQTSQMAGNSSTLAAIALIRWLPLIFFLFAAAQAFSSRADFPLETISPFLRYRRKKWLQSRRPAPPVYHFNVSWPFFVICIYAASDHAADPGHAGEDYTFFLGLCGLMAWALWTQRPKGFARQVFVLLLAAVIAGGFFGGRGLLGLGRLVDNADAALFAQFLRQKSDPEQSRTTMGQIGRRQLSTQIVIRLEPVNGAGVPTYLREAAYRNYHTNRFPFWSAGGPPNDFSTVPETPPNSERWMIQPGQTNRSMVSISCYLNDYVQKTGNPSGLLPLPVDCDHLEKLYAYALKNNSVGAVLCEGPGLVIFNACYGSGGAVDTPPGTNTLSKTNNLVTISEDLAVPDSEKPALDQIIATLPLAGLDDTKKLVAVSRYFAANYQYSLWQDAPKAIATNETALANFLLHTHSGHCEYFATATVLLLREMGLPARYAVGYVVHEPAGNKYVVRERDAHAWCLVWDAASRTWHTFDTTPDSWLAAVSHRTSPWQFIGDLFSWLGYQFAKFRWGQSHLRPYLLMTLLPALVYFLYQILFHHRQHQPRPVAKSAPQPDWPGLDSEFYLLEQKLAAGGVIRRPGQSLTDWLNQAARDPALAGLREPLRQLLRAHYRYRFDPLGLTPAERDQLRRQARECLDALR